MNISIKEYNKTSKIHNGSKRALSILKTIQGERTCAPRVYLQHVPLHQNPLLSTPSTPSLLSLWP